MMEDNRAGTFELYDNQKTLLTAEGRGRASPAVAPGCPGSPQDMQQMVEDLRKEVGDMKSREDNLLQIISDLRESKATNTNSSSKGDGPHNKAEELSGSAVPVFRDEHLKDAHINHLQRQVTTLQANIFKAEGWATRYEEVRKERDQAIDDYRHACMELHQVREQKEALEKHSKELSSNISDLQTWLQQARNDLEVERRHERCQAAVGKLQEELKMVRAERTTFKESIDRLLYENEQLKDKAETSKPQGASMLQSSSSSTSTSRCGSPPCTQELDYLHHVVDTLKHTVLEQRNFLLTMRAASQSQQSPQHAVTMSASSSSSEPITVRSSSGKGSLASPPPQDAARHPNAGGERLLKHTAGHRSASPVQPAAALMQNGVARGELCGALATAASGTSPPLFGDGTQQGMSPLGQRGGGDSQPRVVNAPPPRRSAPSVPSVPSPTSQMVRQPGSSQAQQQILIGKVKQPLHMQNSAPIMRKISHSEVQPRRPLSDAIPQANKAKSDVVRHAEKPGMEGKTYPHWMFAAPGDRLATQHRVASPNLAHYQTATPAAVATSSSPGVDAVHGVLYEASPVLTSAGHYVVASDTRRGPGSPASQQRQNQQQMASALAMQQQQQQQQQRQQIERNAVLHPTQIQAYNMMAGGRVLQSSDLAAIPTPSSTTSGKLMDPNRQSPNRSGVASSWRDPRDPNSSTSQKVNVFPTNNNSNVPAGSTVDVERDPSATHLNADRVCPLCNRNYGQLSMEEFQTHVFECFDDENAPETMKALEEVVESSDSSAAQDVERTCPMCNTTFGKGTQQAEYEKHVHGHFGEELPGDNFEMLNP